MLKTIQIIALTQGVFLLTILFIKKENYKRLNFWLLFVTIMSVLLHVVGDDDFNLIQTDANWFIFHSPLIITLFFLLIRYHNSSYAKFQLKDSLYFIPYLVFVILQLVESKFDIEDSLSYIIFEAIITSIMIYYLSYTIYDIVKNNKEYWMLFFIVPYLIIYLLDSVPFYFTGEHDSIPFIESYGVISLSVLLLYIILFKLVVSPKTVLPKGVSKNYKTSSLDKSKVDTYIEKFLILMNEEKLFIDSNITVNQVAQKMEIPRQHLSQILNVYMKISFQDYINKRRVEEFVVYLKSNAYSNYTIMGIANEVGFKSKSSFNTTFKKVYGVTPSQYKKTLLF